ncbi:MAG TPA: response regulator [Chitinispirillaceae bacterium]|nr:response regulator [Chitinispirillaceae bacterium]
MHSPPSVLVVDDEAAIMMALVLRMKAGGFSVCGVASTKDESVELATREKPDFILMDIRLIGQFDGIEAAREIMAVNKDVRIIFISGYSDGEVFRKAMDLKPLAYLVKPVNVVDVLSIMRQCIENTAREPKRC